MADGRKARERQGTVEFSKARDRRVFCADRTQCGASQSIELVRGVFARLAALLLLAIALRCLVVAPCQSRKSTRGSCPQIAKHHTSREPRRSERLKSRNRRGEPGEHARMTGLAESPSLGIVHPRVSLPWRGWEASRKTPCPRLRRPCASVAVRCRCHEATTGRFPALSRSVGQRHRLPGSIPSRPQEFGVAIDPRCTRSAPARQAADRKWRRAWSTSSR